MAQPTTLGLRVFVAVMAVAVTSGVALAVVAGVVGPWELAKHLPPGTRWAAAVNGHAMAAYRDAIAISLVAGLAVAALSAAVTAVAISRRVTIALGRFSRVVAQVSSGDYGARVEASKLGPEFDAVEAAFNEMAARLEAIEETRAQLIADVTHEMRAPLMTLTAYLDAVEDGVLPADSTSWSVMADQVERLSRLATDMASASTLQEAPIELQDHDLVQLISRTVVAWRESAADHPVRVILTTAPGPIVVRGAPTRLAQVVVNLLDNAVRHAQGLTQIQVEVRELPEEASVIVTDDGAGIAEADRSHVFDRFYRAQRSRMLPGSGLGLAIARTIVSAHGGRIVVGAGAHGGARFVVTLPKS